MFSMRTKQVARIFIRPHKNAVARIGVPLLILNEVKDLNEKVGRVEMLHYVQHEDATSRADIHPPTKNAVARTVVRAPINILHFPSLPCAPHQSFSSP